MNGKSKKEPKEIIFGDKGPDPQVLIHLAPFLSEPFLSRAIMIAFAIQDPFERSCILQALALSEHLSEMRKEELIDAALDAAQKIQSEPQKILTLLKLKPLVSNESRHSIDILIEESRIGAAIEYALLSNIHTRASPTASLKGHTSVGRGIGGNGGENTGSNSNDQGNTWENLIEAAIEREHLYTDLQGICGEENILKKKITNISDAERSDFIRETLARLQTRLVNTGFAPLSRADTPLDPTIPLDVGQPYYFWLEIGQPTLHSIEDKHVSLPDDLPSNAQLKVAIFPFNNEIEITAGADVGELQLQFDGTARVIRQPAPPHDITSNPEILNRRLFFPVKVPEREGAFRLRCSIYYNQILIQSRLISAAVGGEGKPATRVLRSTVDYALSHTFSPNHLKGLESHRLSIFLNNNGDGTHTLSFLGSQEGDSFKHSASIPATELMIPVNNIRKALWKVSWGDENPWKEGKSYCYEDGNCDIKRLKKDLISLAIEGYRLYDALVPKFANGREKFYELAKLMFNPGMVQIAIKNSPTQVLPAALFYDYPLDTQECKLEDYELCETFISALQSEIPLEESPCFKGACPHSIEPDGYICPSGFWGYRHSLGLPVSVADGMDVPPEIILDGNLQMVIGVATNLKRLNEHMKKLQKIKRDMGWHCSSNRKEIINQLKIQKSHLIYFYCHGGLKEDREVPYLQVGDGKGRDYIEGANLSSYRIIWDKPQPLVFINGCHTIALDPECVINLVQAFVNTGSAGVIGTEITIFEPLACNFAEACLENFIAGGKSIGDSVRTARLKLLKEGNPLGLVYTPFVLPSLRIKEENRK